MPSSLSSRLSFRLSLSLLAGALTLFAGLLPAATTADPVTGTRLLRAQLPAGTAIATVDCEPLSRAVVRAIYADRSHAPDILTAALGAGLDGKHPVRRSCKCVVQILHNAVIVAPRETSRLLEAAASLYPDCADSLTEAITEVGDKNPVATDGKDRSPAKAPGDTSRGSNSTTTPGAAGNLGTVGDPGDLGDHDFAGLGFSAGFPGAPGFIGSAPSGGFALPPPAGTPVTSVVNQ